MSRTLIPLAISDISAFARSLHSQLSAQESLPGHLSLLNMLARAAGYRNFQSLRALSAPAPATAPPQAPPPDLEPVHRAARFFDAQGRLISWPAKASLQTLCLWGLWSKLTPAESWSEPKLNAWLRAHHLFGDHAILRRELCDQEFIARTPDGRQYHRVERPPSPQALLLIRALARGE